MTIEHVTSVGGQSAFRPRFLSWRTNERRLRSFFAHRRLLIAIAILSPLLLIGQAGAQVRALGAQALVLDDNAAHTITVQTPQSGSQAYTAWSNAGFPRLAWSLPIPPVAGAQSAFLYPGPQNVGSGAPLLAYWIYPGQLSSLSGSPVSGGATGTWNYAPLSAFSIPTTTNAVVNRLSKFDAVTDLTSSLLSDDGTTLSYNGTAIMVNATTGATAIGGATTINGGATVTGLTTLNGALTASGLATLGGGVTVTGPATV